MANTNVRRRSGWVTTAGVIMLVAGGYNALSGIAAISDDDTIAAVQQTYAEACADSRRTTSSLGLDDVLRGNRRGPLPLRWVYLHMLRELAQHCGHADILREQLLAE